MFALGVFTSLQRWLFVSNVLYIVHAIIIVFTARTRFSMASRAAIHFYVVHIYVVKIPLLFFLTFLSEQLQSQSHII